MKLNVIAYTQPEIENELLKEEFSNSSTLGLAGRFANVCYMAGDMKTVLNQPEEKAIKRAENCSNNLHLSVFEHCSITVALEGVPKIIAMILNSFRLYSTSEKSGRYATMKGLEERDQTLYEKWIEKLSPIIAEKDSTLTSSEVNKLAKENARYFISIFSPSTDLIYTTNIRQWNVIYYDIFMYCDFLQMAMSYSIFEENYFKKLIPYLEELSTLIKSNILDKFKICFHDWKQDFNSLDFSDSLGYYTKCDDFKEYVGYNFSLKTEMSFVALAQKERSRKISVCFSIPKEFKFFTPVFIEDNEELKQEWEKDMKLIFDLIPQGMKVEVVENGLTEDFLQCQLTERLCSRTQYETFSIVYEQAKKIIETLLKNENVSDSFKTAIKYYFLDKEGNIRNKCSYKHCNNSCGKNWRNRIL